MHGGAASLERVARARVIQQHAPHHLRGDGKELRATLPARILLIGETQPRLMHERGRLKRVSRVLAPQHELRLAAKLRVHEPDERVARLNVASTPRAQEPGDSAHPVPRGTWSVVGRPSGRRWGDVGWRDRNVHPGRWNAGAVSQLDSAVADWV